MMKLLHLVDKFLKQFACPWPSTLLKLLHDPLLVEAAEVAGIANLDPLHLRKLHLSHHHKLRMPIGHAI
jgi:hypothetical protein